MGNLHLVEKYRIFDFAGVSDNAIFSDYGRTAYICARADLGIMSDYRRRTDSRIWRYRGAFGYPDVFFGIFVLTFGPSSAELNGKLLDMRKCVPRVFAGSEQLICQRMRQIEQLICFQFEHRVLLG